MLEGPNIIKIIGLSLFCLSLSSVSSAQLDVAGVWMTEARTGIVELKDCGDGTPCGELVWVLPFKDGTIPLDDKNPDSELAKKSMIGVQLLKGFKAGNGKWKSGRIYNPEDGKSYRSVLELSSENIMKVKGCVGPICKTQIWNRLPFNAPNLQKTADEP